ncbi:hypothetical protein HHK36_007455 [Tetracentron sinense]|uniref:Uncharacterized protein n=1 Tax=Tetracentron sinense TaxID=13715 RepID=A0A834ZTI6_TETSI|nr:hypothetical protein HHK36_007455 [Tetracentron sinense]
MTLSLWMHHCFQGTRVPICLLDYEIFFVLVFTSIALLQIKYGDTLRRFSAYVNENGLLDLDMIELRVKILGLFKFAPDADLTLTYIDEDDDVVTLVDDNDLRDATRQCLNPLRINVLLNTTRPGRYDMRSSGSSTPLRSPRVQHLSPHFDSGVAEVLKSVPEPFRDALVKLSHNLTSKTLSSAPVLTELVEFMSKLGLSHLGPVSQRQAGASPSTQSRASENPTDLKQTEDLEASKDAAGMLSNAEFVQPTSVNHGKELDTGNVTRGVGTSVPPTNASMDLNLDLPVDSILSGYSTAPSVFASSGPSDDNGKVSQKKSDGHLSGNFIASGTNACSGVPLIHLNPHPSQSSEAPAPHYKEATVLNDNIRKQFPSGIGHFSASQIGFYPQDIRPINGQIAADGSDVVHPGGYNRIQPFKRSYNCNDSMSGRIFHKGVRCDSCGVHPITGPRFKSKVKEDYDLCSICFSELGNEAEYIRMDRPVSYRSPKLFKESYDPFHHPRFLAPPLRHVMRGGGMKPYRPKLDSRFIQDVNVVDGTTMAPTTPFTKIWRMRNNGTIVWPRGTQLVWIGGDQFTDRVSVEIPVDGFPLDKELDLAVDFTAPERPGRYVSYWRMALPSGQKFGQRIWVLIQVDNSLQDSLFGSFNGLNLNFPPESSSRARGQMTQIIDMNTEPVDGSLPGSGHSNMATELVKPMVDEQPIKDQKLDFPVNDGLLVGNGVSVLNPPALWSYPIIDFSENDGMLVGDDVSVTAPPENPAPVSYPIIDFSVVPSEPSSVIDTPKYSGEVNKGNAVEQTLLKELEEMGFKQIDLNKEILRMNEYNLEQSVDDLCGVSEWDPILEELQEMGFCDKETNKKLLIKNGGSIKRVVLDLITGEKA